MHDPINVTSGAFVAAAGKLRRWLFEAALPLWWQVGADRSLGGYHERIGLDGMPVVLPRRSRVAARQAFCYYQAGQLGWNGPWREAGRHALNFLRERFARGDGTVIASINPDGTALDSTVDLYNQAFALLAYACGHRTLDPNGGWRTRSFALVETLKCQFAHPEGGFREDHDTALPLRSNPHMHLLESALAWMSIDDDPVWRDLADELAALCLDRLIDPAGALREFFAIDWTPLKCIQGEIVEPGHHYEWAYLLARWAALTRRERPAAVTRLIGFADANGVDQARRVVVNRIEAQGLVLDPIARLWPQTERLRAYTIDRHSSDEARLAEAIETLWRYLGAPHLGLWYENLAADGTFVIEAAPATSLYHIVGAVAEFCTAFGTAVVSGPD